MHESTLARQLVRIAVHRAAQAGASRIARVDGWIAETEHLSRESIALQFAAAAKGTAAEGARLDLELVHVKAKCRACGKIYAPEEHLLFCPACGSVGGELLGKTGCGVHSLEAIV